MQRSYKDACRSHGGLEDFSGAYHFLPLETAIPVLKEFAATIPPIDPAMFSRTARLHLTKAGYLVVDIEAHENDESVRGFLKVKGWFRHVTDARPPQDDVPLDDVCRYVIADGEHDGIMAAIGYYLRSKNGYWQRTDKGDVRSWMAGRLIAASQHDALFGQLVDSPWTRTKIPFGPEYPGDRQWNLGAPQHAYQPSAGGPHPTWDSVLSHCGHDLDEALHNLDWAKAANITSGGQYLLCWAACLLREPFEPLPYLFLWSTEENTGKSSFHEALALLITRGVASADRAFTSASDFNGELANAVLAYTEEKDIARTPGARNKLKDWVTSPYLSVRKMHTDAFRVRNTLHFVQTANDRGACPIFPGDSRITAAYVAPLAVEIPKPFLMARLHEEAPHFMRTILDLQLPPIIGRLRLPVVDTAGKLSAADAQVSDYPHAIADLMSDRSMWQGSVSALADELGSGNWPRDRRRARTLLDAATPFFRSRKISIAYLPKDRNGYPIKLVRT